MSEQAATTAPRHWFPMTGITTAIPYLFSLAGTDRDTGLDDETEKALTA
jgi:hypothetical protein